MSKKKILVVDDEKIVLRASVKELEKAGYIVFTAINEDEALNIVRAEKPDLVFADLVMQGTNGVEVCKKVKKILPATIVMLISGYPGEIVKYLDEFIAAGGVETWLRKPLQADELTRAAGVLLGKKTISSDI